MSRFLRAFCIVLATIVGGVALAQSSGLARLDATRSAITDAGSGTRVALALSQGVPFRVFSLSNPNRIVFDFREVDWSTATPGGLDLSTRVTDLRFGPFRAGWSRLVMQLETPMQVAEAGLSVDVSSGTAVLIAQLDPVDQAAFDRLSGPPDDPRFDFPPVLLQADVDPGRANKLRVVIDPGHGGIDPGAVTDEFKEADLMLSMARELEETLRRTGLFDVVMTRRGDYFVSLEQRVAYAKAQKGDVFISLHADSLIEGTASGAAVFTLSEDASDAASAALAERHNRTDLLSGLDLSDADDQVANILMDLARLDNTPRSTALAEHLVSGIRNATGRVHKNPLRQAGFAVLKSADIPSVLVEVGFLSTEEDLKNLRDPYWRAGMAAGIRDGLQAWALEDSALSGLRRQ